jgi:hypothetical protein
MNGQDLLNTVSVEGFFASRWLASAKVIVRVFTDDRIRNSDRRKDSGGCRRPLVTRQSWILWRFSFYYPEIAHEYDENSARVHTD